MPSGPIDPSLIALLVRVYAVALHLAPRQQREAYGSEMQELVRLQLSDAGSRGMPALVRAFVGAIRDLITRAAYERWRRRGRRPPTTEAKMSTFWSDVRHAARSFARQKSGAGLVILTLSLAVAANAAVFTLLDGLFLRPLPFREAERLVYLNEQAPRWNLEYTGINYPDFVAWREHATAFESMGLWSDESLNLVHDGNAERVRGALVTFDLPTALGIRPLLGRSFAADEDRANGPRVVMIGAGLWQTLLAGTPDVIGKVLRVNSQPYTIIGVLPAEAEFPSGAKLWLPLGGDPAQPYQNYSFDGVARLKPGVTLEQARANLLQAQEGVWRTHDTDKVVSPRMLPLRERFVSDFRPMGKALGAAVLLVLLIACANVGGTMLARATFRQREMAMRMALGASTSRVVRQLLTEAVVLAGISGVAGAVLGQWGIRTLVLLSGERLPQWIRLDPNPRTIAFAIVVVLVSALLFGLAPALQLRGTDVRSCLTSEGRTSTGRAHRRLLDGLVVIENSLAAVLLVAAFLLAQAYVHVKQVDAGFDPRGVAVFRVALPEAKYRNGIEQGAFYDRLIALLRAMPGVTAVGAITCPPLSCHQGNFYDAEGSAPAAPDGSDPVILTRTASSGYFAAMGIRLAHGRFFAENEGGPGRGLPVVVNESFAKRMWPNDPDPSGRRIRQRGDSSAPWMTVVGVAKDVKHYGLDQPARPGLYLSTTMMDSANGVGSLAFAVRTSLDPASLAPVLRAVVRQLDPELPVFAMSTMEHEIEVSLSLRRMLSVALLGFAGIALVLAVGGVYAVLSYLVGRRRREIGIRVALGAQEGQVVGMLVREGGRLVGIGVALGLPAALLTARSLSGQLAGVSGRDPMTYAAVALVLFATGAGAALIPARRAARVQPTETIGDAT